MRKLFALYTNEMIKISKRVSIIVILAVMIALIFAFGGLMKYSESMNSESNINYSLENQKENMNNQLQDAKSVVADLEKKKASATGDELLQLESELLSNKNQVDMLQYAIDKNIYTNSNSYRSIVVRELFAFKATVSQLSKFPTTNLIADQKKQLEEAQTNISTLEKIIENNDFKAYIDYSNNKINNNTSFSDEEKKIYLESNELRLKYNLTGEVEGKAFVQGNAEQYIYKIQNGKISLLKDLDYTGNFGDVKPLTAERRQDIENDIAVAEYKFEKDIVNNSSTEALGTDMKSLAISSMLGIGIFMVVILVMILAGGSISSEMSTGSIKSLIISPTKRWKIFVAKFLSLLTIGIITTLIAYIFSIIANGIFFGFNSGANYIYASGGVAHELNFYIYQLARMATDFVPVIVFMTFAFMLSILTRNTAVSVATSIGIYFVGSTANSIIMQVTKGEWRRFIPFNNLNITTKIFPNDSISEITNSATAVSNSATFQIIYMIVLVICMGYIGLDSFNRRDIK